MKFDNIGIGEGRTSVWPFSKYGPLSDKSMGQWIDYMVDEITIYWEEESEDWEPEHSSILQFMRNEGWIDWLQSDDLNVGHAGEIAALMWKEDSDLIEDAHKYVSKYVNLEGFGLLEFHRCQLLHAITNLVLEGVTQLEE